MSGCYSRSSASTKLPDPTPPSREPLLPLHEVHTCSPWAASHGTFLLLQQHTHLTASRAPTREETAEGTCRELNAPHSSIASHLGAHAEIPAQPKIGAVRSSFSLVLYVEGSRAPTEQLHAWTDRRVSPLLGVYST